MQSSVKVVVIGGGPAGLMAAEVLSGNGRQVSLYDAMPSVGRKFLMAGKGGMNITHSESFEVFLSRYGTQAEFIKPMLMKFGPEDLRRWVHGLGINTFIGSSGRIFPMEMKAAPLLRSWIHRLKDRGVRFHMRHRWCGWNEEHHLSFQTPSGMESVKTNAVVLAMGGGSWKKLGSDGAWIQVLEPLGVQIEALKACNCGFEVNWSETFLKKYSGIPVKTVAAHSRDSNGNIVVQTGEFNITDTGLEGGLIYAVSSSLRKQIESDGSGTLCLDLAPGIELEQLKDRLSQFRGKDSFANHLRKKAGLKGVKAGLLREMLSPEEFRSTQNLAQQIKALEIPVIAGRPLDEAISSAGGIKFENLDANLMIKTMPGVFCAGEMLDWEAPTGGYLLTACFSSGFSAGRGVIKWLASQM